MTQKDEKAANVGEGSRLTDPDTAHERNKAMPESEDVVDPAEVWRMPNHDFEPATRKSGGDRVANSGAMCARARLSPYTKGGKLTRWPARPAGKD